MKVKLGYIFLSIAIILILIAATSLRVMATDYYFSTSGNDANTGLSAASPFQTLNKLNSIFPTRAAGDRFLLKGGDTFYGSITIGRSGTSSAYMAIDSYGTGNAIVTGFTTITFPTNLGGGIYETATTSALLSNLNMVVIDGVQYGMGRWPNRTATDGGFMRFESFSGTWNGTSSCTITDAQLTGTPNWVGAEVVIRPQKWLLNRAIVTAHSGGTLTFLGDQQPRSNGYGYFIQNHINTLDQFGEWYYNPSTKKVRMFFGAANPASYVIQATTIDSLLYSSAKSYIRINNITFKGGNGSILKYGGGASFYVDSCHIQFAGIDGADITSNISDFKFMNSNVWDCNDDGVASNAVTNGLISGNYFRNIYMIAGMGGERDGHGWGARLQAGGTIEYNRFVNMGYIGAGFGGSNVTIQNNFFDSFCVVKDDAGAIYSGLTSGYVAFTNRRILNNIAINGMGNNDGTPAVEYAVHPYYLDDNMNGVLIEGNSAAYSRNTGVLLHNCRDIIVRNNTFYDNDVGAVNVLDDPVNLESQGLRFASNIYATTNPTQSTAIFEDNLDGIGAYISSDSNIYANLISSNTSILNIRNNFATYEYHDLPSWRLRYGQDANGKYSLKVAPYRDLVIVGANKIPSPLNNSTMTNAGTGWVNGTYIASGSGLDGGALQITPSSTSLMAVALNIGTITAGTPYVLRFSVKGNGVYDPQSSFGARIRGGNLQYHKVITTREEVEMLFVPPFTGSGTLDFLVSEEGGVFYLDNIYLYQCTATVTNPDDSIRFEYNDTKVNKVVPLTGTWKDVYNASYSTSVTLQPYTSKILIFETGVTTPIVKTNPTITWANPVAITYGTALSGTQLNATASVPGTFVYTPASGTVLNAGTQTLSSEFIPTNETLYNRVTTTRTLTVNKAVATLTLSGLAKTYNTAPQPVTVTTNPAGLTGVQITYNGVGNIPVDAGSYAVSVSLNHINYTATTVTGTLVISKAPATLTISNLSQVYNGSGRSVTVVTSPAGLTGVSVTYNGSATPPIPAGSYPIIASLSNTNYIATNATGTLVVAKATPVITWPAPVAITYPTAISGTQLNATASVSGAFTYSPASGTVLNAGTQLLSVNFVPTDAANYNSVTNTTVSLTVNKAVATITLGSLAQVYDGTDRIVTATTTPSGLAGVTILYSGSTTPPINAGSVAITASLSNPNYTGSTSGTLVISKATATIVISNLSQIYDGTTQPISYSTVPAGLATVTVTYDGSATVPINANSYAVVASLSHANYQATNATGTLVIGKATPSITWFTPNNISYGIALSSTQLNATSGGVPGVFTYSPAAGTILNVGTHVLSVNFVPTDAANYNSVSGTSVNITVFKATATITISNLQQQYDGQPKPVTITTNPVGLQVVTVTYNGSTTPPSAVGSYPVIASLSNGNYTATNATGTLVISTSSAAVTITNINQIYTGSPLPVTVTVDGGWPYDVTYSDNPTVPTNAGTYTVVATINDGIHSGTATATYIISKANPIVTWANPIAITYPTALSGTQLNATANVPGSFTYTPSSGSILNAGTEVLSTLFVPTDNSNYNNAPAKTVTIVVNKGTATMVLNNLNQVYDGLPKPITVTTSPAGLATVTILYNGSSLVPTAAGSYPISASLSNANYTASVTTGTLVIAKRVAGVVISNLAQVYDGSPKPVTVTTNPLGLTTTQTYNGSATVPTVNGTYTVVSTVVDANNQGSATETLVINKGVPVVNWSAPADIQFGTALSATQLNATANVAGVFSYNPLSGTILNVGAHTLTVTFTPTDANYDPVVKTVSIEVVDATATLTLTNLLQTYDGLAKPVIVTSSPANLEGITILYNGGSIIPTAAGSYPIVVSLVNENYTASDVTGTLVIAKADPVLTWTQPQRIIQGTPLTSTQLNATSNIAGIFTYNPPIGTILSNGVTAMTATFVPTDAANYNSISITVSQLVTGTSLNYYISNGRTIYIKK